MQRYPIVDILIIDDETDILNMLKQQLLRNGYDVDTAASGDEGIKKIKHNEYGLIITDIKMPGISGYQVLDFLRNKIKKSTPIVGMSGTPWLLNHTDFNAILPKPFFIKELLALISKLT